jgi:hypothetical protein
MTYALGRPVTYTDRPIVRDIVRQSEADQYRLTTIIMKIIDSVPFRQRAATGSGVVASNPPAKVGTAD